MSNFPPFELPEEFADAIAVKVVREDNYYDVDKLINKFDTYLVINGDELPITYSQGQAILRNRDSIVKATENRIIELLDSLKTEFVRTDEIERFIAVAKRKINE